MRKRIWIDPFQTGLIIRITIYCFLYQGIAWLFQILAGQLATACAAIGISGSLFDSPLAHTLWAVVILLPPLTLDAVRFAHRLVGPLYRLRKTVQAIAAGEPVTLIRLRKGDLLGDFADDFNVMLKRLEENGSIVLKPAAPAANGQTPQDVGVVANASG
jgi:hypothetical protein